MPPGVDTEESVKFEAASCGCLRAVLLELRELGLWFSTGFPYDGRLLASCCSADLMLLDLAALIAILEELDAPGGFAVLECCTAPAWCSASMSKPLES